jgi:hypothetical protein
MLTRLTVKGVLEEFLKKEDTYLTETNLLNLDRQK